MSGLSNLKGKSGLTGLKLVSGSNNSMYGPKSSRSLSVSKASSSGTTGGHSAYSLDARRRRRRRRLQRARRKDQPTVTSKFRPAPLSMSSLLSALPKVQKKKKPVPKKLTPAQVANMFATLSVKK